MRTLKKVSKSRNGARNWYSINLYNTHPDNLNDDCITGADTGCSKEAEAWFGTPSLAFGWLADEQGRLRGAQWVQMIAEQGNNTFTALRRLEPSEMVDDSWPDFDECTEAEQLAAMGMGVKAYNDHRGCL